MVYAAERETRILSRIHNVALFLYIALTCSIRKGADQSFGFHPKHAKLVLKVQIEVFCTWRICTSNTTVTEKIALIFERRELHFGFELDAVAWEGSGGVVCRFTYRRHFLRRRNYYLYFTYRKAVVVQISTPMSIISGVIYLHEPEPNRAPSAKPCHSVRSVLIFKFHLCYMAVRYRRTDAMLCEILLP